MSLYSMNNDAGRRLAHPIRSVDAVRKNYRTALSDLTFNSKPIITHLTILAQENQSTAAHAIVQEIEGQLRANVAEQKLPVLYLIDSICKNVGGVYLAIFARTMVNGFLDAYTLTDPSAQERLERLLQTWKHGLPGGRPVFPRHVLEPIEKSIRFIREKQTKRFSSNTIHVNPNFINNSLGPPTQASSTKELLAQIQHLLPPEPSKSTPPLSLDQIVRQIQAILPTLPSHQARQIELYISHILASSSTSASTPAVLLPVPSPAPVNTTDLLKCLTSLGYLAPELKLDSKALQIRHPHAHDVLYTARPLQCKQCGFRYPKTEQGQRTMDAHLDAHFRQNRKRKEKTRGLSRAWFVAVDAWIQVPTFLQDLKETTTTTTTKPHPDQHLVVKLTDEKKTCAICGETFLQFWNDDEEEWMFKNALLENSTMYHATCHADTVPQNKRKLEETNEKNKHLRLAHH
ncbi:hypothetical protein BY458DRAFT_490932 [Sporodiniella umbellata]|nr:hypothetical protein BY458DRAFT_490932 [Sporodiniella umbellata]